MMEKVNIWKIANQKTQVVKESLREFWAWRPSDLSEEIKKYGKPFKKWDTMTKVFTKLENKFRKGEKTKVTEVINSLVFFFMTLADWLTLLDSSEDLKQKELWKNNMRKLKLNAKEIKKWEKILGNKKTVLLSRYLPKKQSFKKINVFHN